ncbi:dihydrofolate reductase family protein [Pseudonocardia parietis]|uniref:Dihydrofolate reductase n=1 Tax=Pseudonocardia parietis TaxID=570936 RepID=A0ABS4W425_9PSEU|nr:dihydrofolate reductase family protein [Pseudonocardia parietis]MBP2370434.1 dihydrofolate reductase [Pseudonocardia parietis]
MAELIYSMITSLDGYAEAAEGDLGTGADDEEVHTFVYSTTLESVSSSRTRIERTFDPDAVRELKAAAEHDLTVDGPNLAAQAIAAGLVDEYHLFITTSVVGGGTRFFPDGVRLDLDLVEERSFDSGLIYARYRTR